MAYFPFFVEIKNKLCVVVGGGEVAERKVKTLKQFGAVVKVVSPSLTQGLKKLKESGDIIAEEREFIDSDLESCYIAVAATSDNSVNDKVYKCATEKHILVNVADDPDKCSFLFPSTVKRGKLIIGICSSGSFPGISSAVKTKIESLLPQEISQITEVLEIIRKKLKVTIKERNKRKEIIGDIIIRINEILEQTYQKNANSEIEINIKCKELLNYCHALGGTEFENTGRNTRK